MVCAGSTCYMSYRADYDDAMGHTSMTLGSRLEESSFPPYSRDRTEIVITVLRWCMADPRCPHLTHASGSFSSVCLSPHSRSSSFQLIRRSPDLTSLRSVPRKRPYLSPLSFSLARVAASGSPVRLLLCLTFGTPLRRSSLYRTPAQRLFAPATSHYHDSSFLTADHNLSPQGRNCESTLDVGVAPVLA